MSDEPHVRLIDAHAKGDGGDHHHILAGDEGGLIGAAFLGWQARVVNPYLAANGGAVRGDFFCRGAGRSEARRVGHGCVSTCRSRWPPYHYKKKRRLTQTREARQKRNRAAENVNLDV